MPSKSGGNKPATRTQLQDVRSELQSELKDVRSELKDVRSELKDVRSELKDDIKRLGVEILKNREQMSRKDDLKRLEQNMERLLAIATDSAEKGKTYFEKALSHGDILSKHESKLRDHDRRLIAVESK